MCCSGTTCEHVLTFVFGGAGGRGGWGKERGSKCFWVKKLPAQECCSTPLWFPNYFQGKGLENLMYKCWKGRRHPNGPLHPSAGVWFRERISGKQMNKTLLNSPRSILSLAVRYREKEQEWEKNTGAWRTGMWSFLAQAEQEKFPEETTWVRGLLRKARVSNLCWELKGAHKIHSPEMEPEQGLELTP